MNLIEKQLSTVYFKDVRFSVGHSVYNTLTHLSVFSGYRLMSRIRRIFLALYSLSNYVGLDAGRGARGGAMVEALLYKPEGGVFDSR